MIKRLILSVVVLIAVIILPILIGAVVVGMLHSKLYTSYDMLSIVQVWAIGIVFITFFAGLIMLVPDWIKWIKNG